jgi:16S rRNA (guanine527-N7)-methyltransferase
MDQAEKELELITRYFGDFNERQLEQLRLLHGLYHDWNAKINVISRKDMDALYMKHVLHSLSIAAAFDFREGMRVLDLGTGGGFPGVPLAIFFPGARFHLVDSIGKKIKVVDEVVAGLVLTNVTTAHTRVEAVKEKYDTVVSRAVAPLGELWKWSKPILKKRNYVSDDPEIVIPNGLICLKGGDLNKEISESGCRPRMIEISEIFEEEYFKEKYMLYVRVES